MPFFERDGIQFHYLAQGSGMPVVFQHGLGGEARLALELVKSSCACRWVGLDCRGHGETRPLGPPEKLCFNSFTDDLCALLDHLELPRVVLAGTSMGAGVALNCALRFPARAAGLILLRPAWLAGPRNENVEAFSLIAAMLREHGPEHGAELFKGSGVYKRTLAESPDAAASLLAQFTAPRALETLIKLERVPRDAPNWDVNEWQRINVPTLVLANRQDPIHPYEYGQVLAKHIPDARFVELTPKSVSVIHYTLELQSALKEFLENLRSQNSAA